MAKTPEGTLILSNSGTTRQYYLKLNGEKKYISADNTELVRKLAQKDYETSFLKNANKQRKLLTQAIKTLESMDELDNYDKLINDRKKFVVPYIVPDEQYIEKWLKSSHKIKKLDMPGNTILTERGDLVRSKSEKIIADKLYSMGIPYKYECPLKLKNNIIFYPDFTILNSNTKEELYLEHFGMMDKLDYCQNAISKIEKYEKNEIYLGKKLLVTFETSTQTLDSTILEKILKDALGI